MQDTEERRRYLNARSTIDKLLEWRAVPVINENDTVATNEIRYGDNDRLAARVATMASADLLVLLSDIDGLYDAPPAENAGPRSFQWWSASRAAIEAMAGAAGSELSRGGMATKIEAGKIATQSGTHMLIASGRIAHPLQAVADGAPLHLVPHRRPIQSPRARNGSRDRSSRKASSPSTPARWRRCAAARACCRPG